MPEPNSPKTVTRRHFINALFTLGGLGWLTSVVYPLLRYLTPLERKGPGGPLNLDEASLDKIQSQKFAIVRSGSKRIIVLQPDGELKAFSARCTHEGCTVQFLPTEKVIWCACHDGRFDLQGRVISGPPPRPLAEYRLQRTAEGKVVIDVQEA